MADIRQRTRSALSVLQLALALVLLTGAGLLIRSFALLTETDPGFDPHNLLTARVSLPSARYQKPNLQRAFFHLTGRSKWIGELRMRTARHQPTGTS